MTEKTETIERKLEELVDYFVTQGAETGLVLQTIADHLIALRLAYDRDPAPAEEDASSSDPTNEWPSA